MEGEMVAHKSTKDMTASEKRALQEKLDSALKQAIEDVSAFTELYEIVPEIRITNNKCRLGSAKVENSARLDAVARKRDKREIWDKPPVFKLSVSTRECATDDDMRDTLYHEVIHCAPGCFNHGKRFKALAAKVNAAYGTNVTTSKKAFASDAAHTRFAEGIDAPLPPLVEGAPAKDARSLIKSHIGETFKHGRKVYTFTGFNNNPKNSCDLVDASGRKYKCQPELVADRLGLVGTNERIEKKKREAAKQMRDLEIRLALKKKVGKSFKQGRKTYTFTGFNNNPKNCCDLVDANGAAYKCSLLACAAFLGI